jgi:hypothetical protein
LAKVIEITTQSKPPQAKAKAALPPDTVSVEITCGSARNVDPRKPYYLKENTIPVPILKKARHPGNKGADPALVLYQQLGRSGT